MITESQHSQLQNSAYQIGAWLVWTPRNRGGHALTVSSDNRTGVNAISHFYITGSVIPLPIFELLLVLCTISVLQGSNISECHNQPMFQRAEPQGASG